MRLVPATKREMTMSEPIRRNGMTPEQAAAFERLTAAAESGDGAAARRLGGMYREGSDGVRYSPRQAYRWYLRSALAGEPSGQNDVGACFEHGLGCPQSYRKAVEWYRRSAAQNIGTAAMNLGYCYLHGHGVPADREMAVRLFRLAFRQGESRAGEELVRQGVARSIDGVVLVDETQQGRHLGLSIDGTPMKPKAHWLFDVFRLDGRRPEDVPPGLSASYRAYLDRNGVTDEMLASSREWSDRERRAFEKDDCFL